MLSRLSSTSKVIGEIAGSHYGLASKIAPSLTNALDLILTGSQNNTHSFIADNAVSLSAIKLNTNSKTWILPSTSKEPKVLPTEVKYFVEAPSIHRELILERNDPLPNLVPITEPVRHDVVPMQAGPRLLTIRRKKMRKFKRKKRMKRDHFILQKRHLKKKLKAESLFRMRMKELIDDLENFDPLHYVEDVIERAERKWETNVAPSGRKKYGHWSEVMALEELYGLPKNNYINKRAGFITSLEDRAQFEHKRKEYFSKYIRKKYK